MAEEQEDMTPEQAAQLQKDNCIFCKIISGEIPSKKIYDDSDFIGILDINPAAEGHVLLIPKQHFQILPQIPQDIVGKLGIACSKISNKIIRSFKCEGTSIFIANGAVAGQRAPHFMVHVMPRKEGDGISLNPRLADIDERLFNTVKDRLMSSMKVQKGPAQEPQAQNHTPKRETFEEKEIEEDADEENNADEETETNENIEETELEQEHKLKKKRDLERDAEKEKQKKTEKKSGKEKQTESKSEPKSSSKVDFDKLSRLLDK